jgi:hypothetical protein
MQQEKAKKQPYHMISLLLQLVVAMHSNGKMLSLTFLPMEDNVTHIWRKVRVERVEKYTFFSLIFVEWKLQ